ALTSRGCLVKPLNLSGTSRFLSPPRALPIAREIVGLERRQFPSEPHQKHRQCECRNRPHKLRGIPWKSSPKAKPSHGASPLYLPVVWHRLLDSNSRAFRSLIESA